MRVFFIVQREHAGAQRVDLWINKTPKSHIARKREHGGHLRVIGAAIATDIQVVQLGENGSLLVLRVAQRSQRANSIVERRASNDERFERRDPAAEDVRLVVCQADLDLVFAAGLGLSAWRTNSVVWEVSTERAPEDIPGPGLKIWGTAAVGRQR